jgi:hypothetical protein
MTAFAFCIGILVGIGLGAILALYLYDAGQKKQRRPAI